MSRSKTPESVQCRRHQQPPAQDFDNNDLNFSKHVSINRGLPLIYCSVGCTIPRSPTLLPESLGFKAHEDYIASWILFYFVGIPKYSKVYCNAEERLCRIKAIKKKPHASQEIQAKF